MKENGGKQRPVVIATPKVMGIIIADIVNTVTMVTITYVVGLGQGAARDVEI